MRFRARLQPNWRGALYIPPGHHGSPLLDIERLGPVALYLPYDGVEWWEQIDLHPAGQRAYYQDLLDRYPLLPFPDHASDDFRYFSDNQWFSLSDAFTLSSIVRREKPRRIVEIGSGFSSAVMLDTLRHTQASAALTFIEPQTDRLYSLLTPSDRSTAKILAQPVQEVPLSVFDELEAQDVLFVDSSHVAKIGSDVAFIILRILPRLKRGVLVHFHDIYYPHSYPPNWIREGRAWNESLFLRAFLAGSPQYEVVMFNAFAAASFPEAFQKRLPAFVTEPGSSLWIRKVV